ncbi:MAG: DUF4912 domain-containing protein [Leptospiraceae bacterium]|nr:DUF4912 domain-containing protein [Leptospiraceae bacterium]
MTPKKKGTKPIAKKKVKSPSEEKVKLILNSKKSPSTQAKPTQEKSKSKDLPSVKLNVGKIYEDEKFQKPLSYLNFDIIKILTKNPWEAYIFWNINGNTYQKCVDHFQVPSESIQLEICLDYLEENGIKKTRSISIHPLSNNYYCKFENPVANLKALIYANYSDRKYLLFDSAQVSLPMDHASFKFDEQWINQEWVEHGLIAKDANGNIVFQSSPQREQTHASTQKMSFGSSGNSSSRAIGS